MQITSLTWADIDRLIDDLAARLPRGSRCWGVPRGGSVVAALLRSRHNTPITPHWREATIAVDDLIDSGRTAQQVRQKYQLELEPLITKQNSDWIIFPWEGSELADDAETTITRMLQQIGENPNRPQLQNTPRRTAQCWQTLFAGYRQNPADALLPQTRIPPNAAPADPSGLITLPPIPYLSACEKHLLPFHGAARISYRPHPNHPNGGLPLDLPQLINTLANRLQRPRRLAQQICDHLAPHTGAAAVQLEANLLCRMARQKATRPTTITRQAQTGEPTRPAPQTQCAS